MKLKLNEIVMVTILENNRGTAPVSLEVQSSIPTGGPMASLYLLGNPDHYASHKFVTVYWKNYV